LQIKTKIVSCYTADSKPVKQEVNSTVILPLLVFPALAKGQNNNNQKKMFVFILRKILPKCRRNKRHRNKKCGTIYHQQIHQGIPTEQVKLGYFV